MTSDLHRRDPSGAEAQELSQAKARLGVCIFALVYVGGWTLISGPVSDVIIWALVGYSLFSAAWIVLVRRRPGDVPWRRLLVILGDLGINTFFMHTLQARGAFFYPLYLWIIVGNGVRFGPRYLVLATVVGVGYFAPMLVWSSYWRANAVAGSGLLASLVVLPLFYLKLIKSLHETNARLSEEVERSQAATRAKSKFLANMSHELRTPMSGVIGVADLMQTTSMSDRQKEYLDLIQRSAKSLLNIINDVLELSKIEASKVILKAEPLDLRGIVEDVFNLLHPSAKEKGLDLRLSFPRQAPIAFVGDSTRIRQILFNLVGNAVKFTQRGHIEITYRWQALADGRTRVHFDVVDTGIGIAAEKLDFVFEMFEQASDHSSQRFGGAGLGLAISRHLARLMDGDVVVRSELGAGTTFSLTLALEPDPELLQEDQRGEDQRGEDQRGEHRPRPQRALNALVIEDNAVNQLVICGFLKTLGIATETCGDGESALSRVRSGTFDLIFMDVQLPVMDGLETTRRIRAENTPERHTPIIALTANAFEEDRQACLQAGMDLYLHKPLELVELERAIVTLENRGLLDAAGNLGNTR